MKWENELTSLLRTRYPIVQAPMLGVTSPAMVAAVSNEGGLGSLPVGGLSPGKTLALIQATKQLTQQPFAVNLFAHEDTIPDQQQVESMQEFLEKLCRNHQLPYEKPVLAAIPFFSYREQLQVLLDEEIRIVSFTFGVLNDEMIRALKEKGTLLIGTATCLAEAQLLADKGIDVITAQGIEAGGHRGSFLEQEALPQVGTISLVPEIAGSIKQPVIAAGGIMDGRTIRAALLLGAKGVQPGSAFIAADESLANPSYKAAIKKMSASGSVLTRAFTGRWARGIPNTIINEIDRSGIAVLPYPAQANLTGPVRAYALQQDNPAFSGMWAGQSASAAKAKPAAHIFRSLVEEAAAIE